ncbi:MAG: four helix bundle protein [Bacteroidales bacterium]|jgi:four helix bundle protein|nr:four helix bundle protein [Bacteroidales bacterium]
MATINSFEDLEIWKLSMRQVTQVYAVLKDCKDFGFKDQIQRAAISVPSNIAEGFERNTNKEFIQFLHIAKGSNGELITQLYLAITLKYIDKKIGKTLIDTSKTLSNQIGKLISYRKSVRDKR